MKRSMIRALMLASGVFAWSGNLHDLLAESRVMNVRSATEEAKRPIERPWATDADPVGPVAKADASSRDPLVPSTVPVGTSSAAEGSGTAAPSEQSEPAAPRGRAMRLKDVIAFGVRHGREARRIRTTYEQAHDRYLATRADYRPWIGLSGSDEGDRNSSVTKKIKRSGSLSYHFTNTGEGSRSYSANWIHPLFKTNDLALDEAEVDWRIAALQQDLDLVDYRFDIIERFYRLLQAQETVKVDENAVDRWRKTLDYARARFDMGITNKLDLLNNQVALGQAENTLLRDRQTLETLAESLADFLGMNPGIRVWALDDVVFRPIDRSLHADWYREDLAISELVVRSARLRSRDARRRGRPDLTWSSAWTDGSGGVEADLTHSLSLNFQLGQRPSQHTARSTRRGETLRRIGLEGVRARIDLEQRAILRRIIQQEKSIRIAQESLERAEQSVAFAQFNFEKGLARAIDLRDAQDTLTRERSSYLGLLIGYKEIGFEYQKVMGGNLDE